MRDTRFVWVRTAWCETADCGGTGAITRSFSCASGSLCVYRSGSDAKMQIAVTCMKSDNAIVAGFLVWCASSMKVWSNMPEQTPQGRTLFPQLV